MAQYREYVNNAVGSANCTYSTLGSTYSGAAADAVLIPQMSNYVVPQFCSSGPGPVYPPAYSTLTGTQGACGGKFTFKSAYPFANCSSCQGVPDPSGYNPRGNVYEPNGKFTTRPCASSAVAGCQGTAPAAQVLLQRKRQGGGVMQTLFG
jgi:hypothetical protein